MRNCKYCNSDISHKDTRIQFCNRVCSGFFKAENNKASKNCKGCTKVISGPKWEMNNRSFCTRSCATTFNMNQEETREKIFSKLHSDKSKKKQKAALNTIEYKKKRSIIATKNGKKPYIKEASRKAMYNLHKQVHNDPKWIKQVSDSCKERIKAGKFGGGLPHAKPGQSGLLAGKKTIHARTGTIMRSSWETKFADLCDYNHIDWEYETEVFKFGWTRYTPDFKINDTYIDVKPKRRFILQPEIKERFDKILMEFKAMKKELIILDKCEFSAFFAQQGVRH